MWAVARCEAVCIFIRYLDQGNYIGVDINQSVIDARYDVEPRVLDLQSRMPRENLASIGVLILPTLTLSLISLAQSLFTHLTLNQIRECLTRLPEGCEGQRNTAIGRADPHKHAQQSSASGQMPTARVAISTSWLVDDDDWLAPHLFARLREFAPVRAGIDGFRWGSVRLGRDQYTLDADAKFALHPTVTLRSMVCKARGGARRL
jgi:hypothetical protein